jgi:transcriptional regulator with XRE-family HTH domain
MTGKEMRELRLSVGLKQTEVAAELGVDNQTICRWEKAETELKKAYATAFELLVRNNERVAAIKSGRRMRRRLARLESKASPV